MKTEIKISWPESIILDEVKRRINEFKQGNRYANMIYLGFPSEVKGLIKKGILTPYSRETKRALNWYNLTETGRNHIFN